MAPSASRKGTQARASRNRSSSRHSTPLTDASPRTPPPTTPSTMSGPITTMRKETPYTHTSTAALISSEPSIEALIEKSSGSASKPGDPPPARELHNLHDKINDTVNRSMIKRGETCDRSMRQLVQRQKERVEMEREQEASRVHAERAKVKREEDEKRKGKKSPTKKRTHEEMDLDEDVDGKAAQQDSLPTVGAHGVARQDGVGVHEGQPPAPPTPPIQAKSGPDPMDIAASPSESDMSDDDQPSTAPLYERIFGKDPTTAPDPTIYDIRELYDDLSYEERRDILNVAQWPESDLRDLTAGDPPDMDFSNAKPANQVNFSTFQTYIEPYIRPFTEEDVAFLKERGDRVTPYIIPQHGPKGYKEVWAAEDGTTGIEPPQKPLSNPNEARGSLEDLEDDVAEQDTISMGPIMSRLLSIIRPQPSSSKKEDANTEDANGDTSMVNGVNGDVDGAELANGGAEELKPATCLPPDAARRTNLPAMDYDMFEQRALQELRHIGMLSPNESTEFDARNDDEVAARLRTLQHELRRVSHINNVRKARVLELTEERMAMQEYSNIADDLDNQVNAAYLKRNRSLARPNQKKGGSHPSRPGQKGVAAGAAGARGVSDGVRALMQKRRDWIEMVGPVVAYGRPPIPGDEETIFDEASMKRLEKAEREAELGEGEGE